MLTLHDNSISRAYHNCQPCFSSSTSTRFIIYRNIAIQNVECEVQHRQLLGSTFPRDCGWAKNVKWHSGCQPKVLTAKFKCKHTSWQNKQA